MNFTKQLVLLFLFHLILFSKVYSEPLIITGDKNYAPYSYLDSRGNPKGLLVDVWKEWAKTTDTKIKFELKDWVESINALQSKNADIHSGVYSTVENTYEAKTLYSTNVSLFANKAYDQELTSQSVGVIAPDFGKALKKDYPQLNIIAYNNYELLFADMDNNKLDLFFDSTVPVLDITSKTDLDALLLLVSNISRK